MFIVHLFTLSYLNKWSRWSSRKNQSSFTKSLRRFLGSLWIDFQKETIIFALPEWDTSSSVKPPKWVAWFLRGGLREVRSTILLNIKTLESEVHNPLSPLKASFNTKLFFWTYFRLSVPSFSLRSKAFHCYPGYLWQSIFGHNKYFIQPWLVFMFERKKWIR